MPNHKHRGLKITEYTDRRSGLVKFKSRFQLKGIEYTPKKNSLESLKKEINRIFTLSDEGKNPKTFTETPFIDDVLKKELSTITDHKKKVLYERVYADFLSLIPPLRFDELTQADFNTYIEFRKKQVNERTGESIKNATINKELSAISVALRSGPKRFRSLDGLKPIEIEKLPNDYEPRTRTVAESEFTKLFAYLYSDRKAGEREKDWLYRVRLGHWLEFQSYTGLRRKEIAILRSEQYDSKQKAFINLLRPKTNSKVDFFPLQSRAAEIVEERLKMSGPYIFTDDGLPIESHYRALKNICKSLNIKYGSFTEGGFVLHDLRRNFATEIVQATDIETAREFLGHADLTHTGIYLRTDKKRMSDAVRKLDGVDLEIDVKKILEDFKSDKISLKKATKKMLKIIKGR